MENVYIYKNMAIMGLCELPDFEDVKMSEMTNNDIRFVVCGELKSIRARRVHWKCYNKDELCDILIKFIGDSYVEPSSENDNIYICNGNAMVFKKYVPYSFEYGVRIYRISRNGVSFSYCKNYSNILPSFECWPQMSEKDIISYISKFVGESSEGTNHDVREESVNIYVINGNAFNCHEDECADFEPFIISELISDNIKFYYCGNCNDVIVNIKPMSDEELLKYTKLFYGIE